MVPVNLYEYYLGLRPSPSYELYAYPIYSISAPTCDLIGNSGTFTTEALLGEVNGDGAENVSDVTTLVNMILGVIPKDNTRADIDGNGTVNVSDVTALVRLILNV